jgi:hypothetical protein
MAPLVHDNQEVEHKHCFKQDNKATQDLADDAKG